jgi:hypothetical protein
MGFSLEPILSENNLLIAIRTAVFDLPRQELFQVSPEALVDTLLTLFDFSEEENTLPRTEKCSILLNALLIDKSVPDVDIPEITNDRVIDQFLFRLIGFSRLPKKEYQLIFKEVREDLKAILELIEFYEEDDYIKAYLASDIRPEHEMKVRIDFYERCRKERDFIVKYVTYGIYNVALYNAWLPHPEPVPEKFTRDGRIRPYYFRPGSREAYFDFRKIDHFGHRLSQTLTEGQRQYLLDKFMAGEMEAFYEALRLVRPPENFFEDIRLFYPVYSPIFGDRKQIFEELDRLFVGKHWYGFVALALLQIEGVFSDIVAFIGDEKKNASLSTKVNSVRPYYYDPAGALDYFEYHLPRIRNRLAHAGHLPDHDPQILSYDMLYDLWFLLELSTRLSDASTRLNAACMANWTPEFIGLMGLAKILSYVERVNALKRKGKFHSQVLEHWELYRKKTLCAGDLAGVAKDLSHTLSLDIFLAVNAFNREAQQMGKTIDLDKMEIRDVQSQSMRLTELLSKMSQETKEKFGELYQTARFLRIYNHHLPECEPIAKERFEKIRATYKLFLGKVELLKAPILEFGFGNLLV